MLLLTRVLSIGAGAYASTAVYTGADVDKIVRYAHKRGIRVVPEVGAYIHFQEKQTNHIRIYQPSLCTHMHTHTHRTGHV